MHIFHSWSKWVVDSDRIISYIAYNGTKGTMREIVQSRECTVCALKQFKVKDID